MNGVEQREKKSSLSVFLELDTDPKKTCQEACENNQCLKEIEQTARRTK